MRGSAEVFSTAAVTTIGRRPDLILAAVVAFIISMLIVPLPTFLLDSLIAVNIAGGVIVLMVALFANRILEVTSFPSLLLVTTLFRLGLNVSTTRGILANADAGEVVASFGKFVVQGDVVVGLVIFLVITLVQFLVIAKGSERVAEVSARFTLDAMPGKQMSIDAALRQGALTEEEAQEKREELGRESQMFGNMDGAMKFVKGDAIAGLIITALNLVAGFVIGVARNDMTLSTSLEVYTILTVGDGLVSQISALLITLAAGMITTKVQGKDNKNNLGFTVKNELFGDAKVLYVAAVMVLVLGMVPGLPFVPFALIGFSLVGINIVRAIHQQSMLNKPQTATAVRQLRFKQKLEEKIEAAKNQKSLADKLTPSVVPISVDLDPTITAAMEADGAAAMTEFVDTFIPQLRDALYLELGIRYPGIRVTTNASGVPKGGYQIRIRDVPVIRAKFDPTKCLAMAAPQNLRRLGVEGKDTKDPLNGNRAALIDVSAKEVVEASGIVVWTLPGVITLQLAQILRRQAKEFIGLHEVNELVDRLEKAYPALVREVVPKVVTLPQIVDVLRRLVDERVCIRDLKTIVEALGEHGAYENDGVWLTERVRASLGRQLAHSYAGVQQRLQALLLDPTIEDTILSAIQRTNTGGALCLEPEVGREIIDSIEKAVSPMLRQGIRPAILTTSSIRRFVRRLLEAGLPTIPVLSYEELPSDLVVQPMGRATL